MLKRFSALSLCLILLAITPAVIAAPPAAPKPAPAAAPPAEQHPHIRTAIRELREARRELETAAHDFGGHRKEAMEAVDNAIKQLQEALQYDKK